MTPSLHWPPAIAPAFVASLLIHAALAFALIGVITMGRPALGDGTSMLAVRLVEPPASLPLVAADVAPTPLPVAESPTMAPMRQPAATPPDAVSVAAPTPEPPQPPEAQPAPSAPVLPLGEVDIAENYYALSSLQEELVLRTQGAYLAEVEKPVRVLQKPVVGYPADALAAQRSGTVVAWLAISREGAIEEVIIDSGEPEFAEAVTAALPTAKFLPAEEKDELIPFYIVMVFEFRSGSAIAPPAAEASPEAGPDGASAVGASR